MTFFFWLVFSYSSFCAFFIFLSHLHQLCSSTEVACLCKASSENIFHLPLLLRGNPACQANFLNLYRQEQPCFFNMCFIGGKNMCLLMWKYLGLGNPLNKMQHLLSEHPFLTSRYTYVCQQWKRSGFSQHLSHLCVRQSAKSELNGI